MSFFLHFKPRKQPNQTKTKKTPSDKTATHFLLLTEGLFFMPLGQDTWTHIKVLLEWYRGALMSVQFDLVFGFFTISQSPPKSLPYLSPEISE